MTAHDDDIAGIAQGRFRNHVVDLLLSGFGVRNEVHHESGRAGPLLAPRVRRCLLYAAFLSIFAFAGLTGGHGVSAGLMHFLTQILPALVVLAVLAIAWRRQRLGAALFLGLAAAYVTTSW